MRKTADLSPITYDFSGSLPAPPRKEEYHEKATRRPV